MNKTKQKNNTSGYRGVSWHKRDKKWQARITIKQKEIYIGCFDDIEDAICAYQQKAKELFGEYMGEF